MFYRHLRIWLPLLVVCLLLGCGEPEIARENLRLTMALRTAISSRQGEWLEACRKQLEEKRASAEVSAAEYARFQEIFSQADAGKWDAAERDLVQWQKEQRP